MKEEKSFVCQEMAVGLTEGARSRYVYQNFFDRDTEFDTLNRVHVPYAAEGGSALSPEITRVFAKEMLARILKKSGRGEGWEEESSGRKKWKMMVE